MPETARSKPLEIWFQDEARVGQQGTLTRIWAERGTRPRAPRDTRYIWSYIFGAVCPERAEAAALIMPHADTQAMSAHLAEIAKTVASGAHALLILDGAGWHGSAELEVPDNITLPNSIGDEPEGRVGLSLVASSMVTIRSHHRPLGPNHSWPKRADSWCIHHAGQGTASGRSCAGCAPRLSPRACAHGLASSAAASCSCA